MHSVYGLTHITDYSDCKGKDFFSFPHFTLYGLNFLIVNKINELLPFAIKDVESHLNDPVTKQKLSTLHIAVIFENGEAVEQLLATKINCNCLDARKWTPLHHAALSKDEKIKKLLMNISELEATTDTGLTYREIIFLTTPPIIEEEAIIPLYTENEKKEWVPLNQKEFNKLTNAWYINQFIASKKRLIFDWKHPNAVKINFPFTDKLKEVFKIFLNTSPSFLIKKVHNDSSGIKLPFSPGLGLFAMKDYKKEDPVGEYMGKLVEAKGSKSHFLGGVNIDALNYLNGVAETNDSFPNIGLILLNGEEVGYPSIRAAFFCIESIKKGQEIYWNYGFHNVKLGPYIELRPKEMRTFVKTHTLDDLKVLLTLLGLQKLSFDLFGLAEQFRYILSTPSALFSISLDGTLTEKDSQKWLNCAYDFEVIPKNAPSIIKNLTTIASQCIKLKNEINEFSPEAAHSYFEYIQSISARFGIKNALIISTNINTHLFKMIVNLKKELGAEWKNESNGIINVIDAAFMKSWNAIKEKTEIGIKEELSTTKDKK